MVDLEVCAQEVTWSARADWLDVALTNTLWARSTIYICRFLYSAHNITSVDELSIIRLLGDTPERFASQGFILMGMNGGVVRWRVGGTGSEAAIKLVLRHLRQPDLFFAFHNL